MQETVCRIRKLVDRRGLGIGYQTTYGTVFNGEVGFWFPQPAKPTAPPKPIIHFWDLREVSPYQRYCGASYCPGRLVTQPGVETDSGMRALKKCDTCQTYFRTW